MALSSPEFSLAASISARRERLLSDLRLHVETPTGGGNTPALDRTRSLFAERLRALGAMVELIPGEPKPEWLHGVRPSGTARPTLIARRVPRGRAATPVLLSGHL